MAIKYLDEQPQAPTGRIKYLDDPEPTSFKQFGKNLVSDAGEQINGLIQAALNLPQTVKGLGGLIAGGVEKTSPAIMALKGMGVVPKELPHEKYADAFIDEKKAQYGSPERIGKSIYEHPVRTAMDVATIVEPFTGGMTKTAVASGGRLRDLAKAPGKYVKGIESEIGSQITPIAEDVVRGRLDSMNPDAMRAIGVNPEKIKRAGEVSGRVGLTERPSKAMADSYYDEVIKSAPDNAQIPTSKLEEANRLDSNAINPKIDKKIKELTGRTRLNEKGVLERQPLSKQEYQDLRAELNNLDPSGEIPAVQAKKAALDEDAGTVIQDIHKAKGTFQVSRDLSKVETYLNNPKLKQELQSLLKKAQGPDSAPIREHITKLLGEEDAAKIFKALDKNKSKRVVIGRGKAATRMVGEGVGVAAVVRKLLGG